MAETTKTVTLKSCDGVEVVVSESVAMQSKKIRDKIEANGAENTIPLTDLTAKTLGKVIEYCKQHVEGARSTEVSSEEDLKKWDQQFLDVDVDTLFDMEMAAHSLDISTLTHAVCKKLADMAMGKTVKEMRQVFNVPNDFTSEEEEQLKREHSWMFD